MKKKNKKTSFNRVNEPRLSFIIVGVLFIMLLINLFQITTATNYGGANLHEFQKQRTVRKRIIPAKRGTIYDASGEALAYTVSTYDLYAYIDPSRTKNKKKPMHVVDIDEAATKLAEALNAPRDYIYDRLNKGSSGLKITYFGKYGKNLSTIEKDKILDLKIPGLGFDEKSSRYYPYGDFLSYTLGFSKNIHNKVTGRDEIKGLMGIEKAFDKQLKGEDGYTVYVKDNRGNKIPGSKEINKEVKNGSDIYLTIDSKIQLFVEQAFSDARKEYNWDTATMVVASAKTGEILAMASNPSFNPNLRNITNYLNPAISVSFEPGSTQKIYSYMAAMENGTYNGNAKYKSGSYTAKDGTVMGDWNQRKGWGMITFDEGFALSSNTAAMNLILRGLSGERLKDYYRALGFGSKTNIELADEVSGKLDFTYETEIMNATFGQGILTTPIQNIKALTPLANDGNLLQPYIIKKIKSGSKTTYTGTKKVLGKVASTDTVHHMRDLMESVVNGTPQTSTGYIYYQEGYKLIAKTGTAQVSTGKGYGKKNIRGIASMFPKDNPEVIIYFMMKNPNKGGVASVNQLPFIMNRVVTNTSNYLNIFQRDNHLTYEEVNFKVPGLINKKISEATPILDKQNIKYYLLGEGEKIIDQYPKEDISFPKNNFIYLLTSYNDLKMPKFNGLSHKDALALCNMLNLKCIFKGEGFVTKASINEGEVIDRSLTQELDLNKKEF